MASPQAFVGSSEPLGSSWERLLPVSGVPCLSPRVALQPRPRVQPQPWWPQKTEHYPMTLPPAPAPCEAAIPAATASPRGRLLPTESPVAQQAPGTHHRDQWCPSGRYPSSLPSQHRAIPRESPRRLPSGAAVAGKELSGEAIWCEEKPISCSKGCFAQRFTKCADATALPRWDINMSLVDVD